MYCEAAQGTEAELVNNIEQLCSCKDCEESCLTLDKSLFPLTLESYTPIPLEPNYNFMYDNVLIPFLRETRKQRMFYVVCNAFDDHYAKNPEWYKGLSWYKNVRKFLLRDDPDVDYFCVKEQDAAKHHLNFLVVSDFDFTKYHEVNRFHCRWDVQEVYIPSGRLACGMYMLKESKNRHFFDQKDYWNTIEDRYELFVKSCNTIPGSQKPGRER